jgi:hypothetical protein
VWLNLNFPFEFMVGKGLDPLEENRGRSSLDIAAACGKKEILELFQYHSQGFCCILIGMRSTSGEDDFKQDGSFHERSNSYNKNSTKQLWLLSK